MANGLPEGFSLVGGQPEQSELPEGFVVATPASPRDDTPEEVQDEKGFFESFSDWFSGADRTTQQQAETPTIIEGGFLSGEDPAKVAHIASMALITNDQNELANIIKKQFPDVVVQYNKDKQGEIYPVLTNKKNGQTAIIDRPGVDALNLSQFAGQAALFSRGVKGGLVKVGATEAARESAIQTAQAASGGEFDVGDVAASAFIGSAMEPIQKAVGFGYRAITGKAKEAVNSILSAADEFNVPVLTSDIYNPETWAARGAQIASEWLPVVGTGGMRNAQQQAREQALEDFVSMYRGGTYEEVVQEVGAKSKELRNAASAVYNKVNPYLDQLSLGDGVPMNNTKAEMDKLTEYLTTPGLDVDDSIIKMLDDFDDLMTGTPQSFQVLKDNIGSWHERLNSIDPNSRMIPSKIKSKFDAVLSAARKDRDEYAKANLNDIDYGNLKAADRAWGETVTDMSTSKLKAILDKGEATPEVVRQMMFSRNKSDIDRLYKSLTPKGRSAAQAAFIGQIASDLSKQQKELTPTSFASALTRYSDGIDALFKGKDKDYVEGFINLMNATKRAQEVAKGSGSETFERAAGVGGGVAGVGALATGIVPFEAFAAYGTLGGMARLFESPRVRNILIKAKSMEPGSDALQKAGTEFANLVRMSLQASPTKGTTEFERELSEEMNGGQE